MYSMYRYSNQQYYYMYTRIVRWREGESEGERARTVQHMYDYYVNYYVYSTGMCTHRPTGGRSTASMAAARSSKNQWRAFLAELVDNADTTVLTARDAFAALRKQFGEDVNATHRETPAAAPGCAIRLLSQAITLE